MEGLTPPCLHTSYRTVVAFQRKWDFFNYAIPIYLPQNSVFNGAHCLMEFDLSGQSLWYICLYFKVQDNLGPKYNKIFKMLVKMSQVDVLEQTTRTIPDHVTHTTKKQCKLGSCTTTLTPWKLISLESITIVIVMKKYVSNL